MKAHMRKLLKIFTSRVVVVGLALLVQLSWYLLFLNRLANYSIVVNGFFRVLSVIILLYLIRKDENSAYKIAWMILIMMIPLLGGILYVMIGNKKPGKKLAAKMAVVKDSMTDALKKNEDIITYTNAFISLLQDTLRMDKDSIFVLQYFSAMHPRFFPICPLEWYLFRKFFHRIAPSRQHLKNLLTITTHSVPLVERAEDNRQENIPRLFHAPFPNHTLSNS